MDKSAKIYIASHRGLVGSAVVRNLQAKGFTRLKTRTHAERDELVKKHVNATFDYHE